METQKGTIWTAECFYYYVYYVFKVRNIGFGDILRNDDEFSIETALRAVRLGYWVVIRPFIAPPSTPTHLLLMFVLKGVLCLKG